MADPILAPQPTEFVAPAPAPTQPAPPPSPQQQTGGFNDDRGPQGSVHPGQFPELQPVAAPPASPAPPEVAAATPGPEIAVPPVEPAAPTAPLPAAGARAAAVALGYANANQFPDDNSFLTTLMQAAANGEAYRVQLLRSQQQLPVPGPATQATQTGVQPATAPAPSSPFKGPEWNPQWEPLIVKNADGSVGLVPGADPTILPKYHAYTAHRRQLADRLLTDPEGTLGPLIDQRAAALAEEKVRQAIGQQSAADYVNRFVQENTGWLHVRDQSGQVMINPATQMPFLSATGQRFQGLVQQAEQMGIRDVRQQEAYARQSMQNEYLLSQQQQAAQQQQTTQATIQANRRPSVAGTLPRPGQPSLPPPPGGDLRLMMEHAMREAGITDQTLAMGNG